LKSPTTNGVFEPKNREIKVVSYLHLFYNSKVKLEREFALIV
jgi:hypothetical protein